MSAPKTPASSDKGKRELSSPFDPNDPKKVRPGSASSETQDMDTSISSTSSTHTHTCLCDEDLEKIKSMLTSTLDSKISTMINSIFESKITDMVTTITENVFHGLNVKVKGLESENALLKEKLADLEKRLDNADEIQDRANQYSRRNCLRLSGVKETADEDTDKIVLEVAKAIDADITLDQIDRSHRLGPPRPARTHETGGNRTKPRDIIVKFVSYRPRSRLFKNKSKLRQTGFKGSFINEDLTRPRSDLFYQCRHLAKNKHVNSSWTSDGVVLVKDNHNKVHRIETKHQLADLKAKIGVSR